MNATTSQLFREKYLRPKRGRYSVISRKRETCGVTELNGLWAFEGRS